MSALKLRTVFELDHMGWDAAFGTRASRDGDEVAAMPGCVVIFARNLLKHRARSVTVACGGAETSISVRPGGVIQIGPVGSSDGVSLTYPRNRGLRIAAALL